MYREPKAGEHLRFRLDFFSCFRTRCRIGPSRCIPENEPARTTAMSKVTSVEFVTSATSPSGFPATDLPEIAFVGRSNVGKSSLLNALVNRRNLARTSSTPGKTRQINFFRVNNACHFVDLPGYGYAKVAKTEREAWRRTIESYLVRRDQLRLVVSLIDVRHDPTVLDRELADWLESIERPFVIVLTKSDKVKAGDVANRKRQISEMFGEHRYLRAVLSFSTRTSETRADVWSAIAQHGLRN